MKIKGREPVLRFPTREALDLDLELQKIGHQRADAPELSSIFYLTLNTVASRELSAFFYFLIRLIRRALRTSLV